MATLRVRSPSPTEHRPSIDTPTHSNQQRNLLTPDDALFRRPTSATSSYKVPTPRRATAIAGSGSTFPGGLRRLSSTEQTRQRRSHSTYGTMPLYDNTRRNSRRPCNVRFNFQTRPGSRRESATSVVHVDKEKCRRKLMSWMQIVTVLIKLHRKSKLSLFEGTLYREQLEHIDRTSNQLAKDDAAANMVLFNPNEYKANKQMRMSEKAKCILRKPPEERTEEDVYYASIALRGISLISEYPVRMQRKLAKFGIFQSFEARRVIVRHGHAPFAFYFILYGTVIVAVAVDDVQDAHTVCFLKRGESFGELSIMNGTPRQSTVLTQDDVEMLAIDVMTYEQIFMVGGAKNINDPDHHAFMASLPFLKGWPLAALENQENEKSIVFAYFKRDAVIIRDSNYNGWIYIVKSGSVQVLKKLVKKDATVHLKTGKLVKYTTDADIFWAFKSDRCGLDRLMSTCGIDFSEPIMDRLSPEHKLNVEPEANGVHEDALTLLSDYTFGLNSNRLKRTQSAIIRTRGSGTHLGSYQQTRSHTVMEFNGTPHSKRTHGLSLQKNTTRSTGRKKYSDTNEINDKQAKRTYLDDLDSGFRERAHIRTEADDNPMFVHVQTLTKGDAFGLANIVFPDQPGLCLVSNGAECVLIKKKLYEDNCPVKVMRRLKTELSPYPSDSSLQDDLLTTVNWNAYKKATMNQLILLKQSKKNRWVNTITA